MSSGSVILDIQFVVGNNGQYFAKEVSILRTGSVMPDLYFFKSPYPQEELQLKYKLQNEFNFKNINGLKWNSGIIDYNELPNLLSTLASFKIYVKGLEKKQFIQKYLSKSKIINLNIPKLSELENFYTSCKIHNADHHLRCAVQNSVNIYLYMLVNKIFE